MDFKQAGLKMVLTVTFVFLFSVSAYASDGLTIEKAELFVMPEYDAPGVLVIQNLDFVNSGGEPFDGPVQLKVPSDVTSTVARDRSSQSHEHIPSELVKEGEDTLLVWQPKQPIAPGSVYPVSVEYYYNPISGNVNKSIDFKYLPSYPVNQLLVSVVRPLRSTDFSITPATTSSGTDDQGFEHFSYDFSNISLDDAVEMKISYVKEDPNPSIQKGQPPSQSQSSTSEEGKMPLQSYGLLAFLAVAAVGIIFLVIKSVGSKASVKENTGSRNVESGQQELEKLRAMLMAGKISEETYLELRSEIKRDSKRG